MAGAGRDIAHLLAIESGQPRDIATLDARLNGGIGNLDSRRRGRGDLRVAMGFAAIPSWIATPWPRWLTPSTSRIASSLSSAPGAVAEWISWPSTIDQSADQLHGALRLLSHHGVCAAGEDLDPGAWPAGR
jgi:hypothetical protein